MSGRRVSESRARLACVLTVFLVVASISPQLVSAAPPEDLFSGVKTLIVPFSTHPGIRVDGVISPGEYDKNVSYMTPDTDISISLMHDNVSLYVGIQGPTWSWVALGISSDGAATMGFVIVAKSASGYEVQEAIATDVSDVIDLTPARGEPALEDFEATATSNQAVAELRLSLDSNLWMLVPGAVDPAVVATNLTAPSGFPTVLSGSQVHFMGSYLLRQVDNVHNVNELLNGTTSPVPSSVAFILIVVGISAIVFVFVARRRKA